MDGKIIRQKIIRPVNPKHSWVQLEFKYCLHAGVYEIHLKRWDGPGKNFFVNLMWEISLFMANKQRILNDLADYFPQYDKAGNDKSYYIKLLEEACEDVMPKY